MNGLAKKSPAALLVAGLHLGDMTAPGNPPGAGCA